MGTERELLPRITKVWAKNFRSIEYAELELDALTVLVGPNASGKSNLLDILSFLGDAAKDGLESAIEKRGGMGSIRRRPARGKVIGPEIGVSFQMKTGTLEYSFALANAGNGEYRVSHECAKFDPATSAEEPLEIELNGGRVRKPRLKMALNNIREHTVPRQESYVKELYDVGLGNHELNLLGEKGNRFQFRVIMGRGSRREGNSSHTWDNLYFSLFTFERSLASIVSYQIFPNSLREPQKIADSHPLAGDGRNLVSAVRGMIRQENRFLPDLKHALGYAVPGVSDIRVSRAGSYQVVELKHEEPGRSDRNSWFDLSYESDGTLRLLGMLVALFQEPSPSLIGIEEPELMIHPGALAVLADTMQEATLRGQVLVTTHSPDLINLLPIECFRAVTAEGGTTKVGKVSDHQIQSVKEGLFLAGELHSMEGLQVGSNGD